MASVDDVRDFWDRRPCNVRHAQLPGWGSSQDEWREYSGRVSFRKYAAEPHIGEFMGLGRVNGQYILDLGCGIGTQALSMAQAGAFVDGVDISTASLNIANMRSWGLGINSERLTFRRDDMEILAETKRVLSGLNSRGYDRVWAFGTVHHTPHPTAALRAAYDVLVPGGELRLMVYHKRAWKWLWAALKYRTLDLDKLIPMCSEAQSGSPVTYAYTMKEARELVESVGFKVYACWVDHIFPYRIGPYRRGEYKKTLYWQLTPQPVFRWAERNFGLHLMLKARKPC